MPVSEAVDRFEGRLLRAARRILRPLVRILIRNGVAAPAMQELMRKVYVDVAYEEFGPPGKSQTLARVSVITGLNRKEVARLYKLDDVTNEDRLAWHRCGKVLDGWLTDAAFQSEAGFPLDLPFSGDDPSFTGLVKRYSGDMYPTPMREELLRVGAITEVEGRLRMTNRGYVPGTDPSTKVDILGMDTAEFIETIDHNVQGFEPPLVQRKVVADNLPEEHKAAFEAYSRRVALNAMDEIRRWLIEHDAGGDRTGSDQRYFAGFGVYQIMRPRDDAARMQDETEPRGEAGEQHAER